MFAFVSYAGGWSQYRLYDMNGVIHLEHWYMVDEARGAVPNGVGKFICDALRGRRSGGMKSTIRARGRPPPL